MNVQIINRSALGYDHWLSYTGVRVPKNNGVIKTSKGMANVHPWIQAEQKHVDALTVELGDWICGVRWFS